MFFGVLNLLEVIKQPAAAHSFRSLTCFIHKIRHAAAAGSDPDVLFKIKQKNNDEEQVNRFKQ